MSRRRIHSEPTRDPRSLHERFRDMVDSDPQWTKIVQKCRKYGDPPGHWLYITLGEQREHLARLLRSRRIDLWKRRRFKLELQRHGLTWEAFQRLVERDHELTTEVVTAMSRPKPYPFSPRTPKEAA